MKRNLTCIICPRGCALSVNTDNGDISVTGNSCPKGKQYAIDECTNPTRTVTSSVTVANRGGKPVSVKTANPVPKDKIFEVMKQIRAKNTNAPIAIGDIIIENICGTDIIATKNMD